MDYLKEFLNLEEYETYKDGEDFVLPNVSLVNNPYSVKYTPYTPPNYFRITNLENAGGEIYFDAVRSSSYPQDESYPITLEYCVNGDGVWTSVTDGEQIVIPIPAEGYVELRGDNISMSSYNYDYNAILYWNLTVEFNHNLSGDIMSICGFSDTLEDYHFYHFFENNTTLIDASNLILPATMLAEACYSHIFCGCTNLVTAPKLPATTLAYYCYNEMFRDCTSLTTAPELPATILAINCYSGMFYNCTSLITAPELPATSLVSACYNSMFRNCTNLNYIKAMFITTPSISYTNTWVSGVASTGTFVKSPAAAWNVTGSSGVPTGWDVEAMADEYFTTIAREDGTISFNIWKSMGTDMITSISYSTDNGETWNTTDNEDNKSEHLVIDVDVNEGDKILWKGDAQQLGYFDEDNTGESVGSFFSSDCEFDAQGNIMSLLYSDDFYDEIEIYEEYEFCNLFHDYNAEKSCEIVNAKNLSLCAPSLEMGSYYGMFRGCASLKTAPVLPATALVGYCYYSMFANCTSLTTAPELPATTLSGYCYFSMFSGCTSLTAAPVLPATTLADSCYYYMFYGCTSLTVAPELPATTLVSNCYGYMFRNCASLNYIKAMFITISHWSDISNWVNGVASSGTFVKNSAATWNATGNSGIPSGWTVQTASE